MEKKAIIIESVNNFQIDFYSRHLTMSFFIGDQAGKDFKRELRKKEGGEKLEPKDSLART